MTMYICPLNKEISYDTCMNCVNDNSGPGICGACPGVIKNLVPFTCNDCGNQTCKFSGNKEQLVCYECLTSLKSEADGYWEKINGEDILFCSSGCAHKRKNRLQKVKAG